MFYNPKKFIRCCQCGNTYNMRGNLYEGNILVCPHCGLQHKVDFTLIEKQPVGYKLETINLTQDGSESNPWQVSSVADLQNVGHADDTNSDWSDGLDDNGEATNKYDSWAMDDYYIQTADIDLDGGTFNPIGGKAGTGYTEFSGNYNGDYHKIYNGSISKPNDYYVGIFARIERYNGTVKNLGSEINILGKTYVGGIVGELRGIIENCYSTGNVSGSDNWVGGLVGRAYYGKIYSSYATGDVSGNRNVGGISGQSRNNGIIENCYATGDVTATIESGNAYLGGITGDCYYGTIRYSYSTCKINYIEGVGFKGGLAGDDYSVTDTENYWDTDTSEIEWSAMGTGKTTTQMKDIDTYVGNWDMVAIGSYADEDWYIDDGNDYPRLGWEYEETGGTTEEATNVLFIFSNF